MKGILASVCLLLGVCLLGCLAAPGPDCSSPAIQDYPPKVRNLCIAYYQFSNALQSYVDEQNSYSPMIRDGRSAANREEIKRQDVDHVFLRFGRRR